MVNALLVYPKNPVTFWSYDEALKIAGKKSAFPPNGLLTVAGMLPDNYNSKLVDLNVENLEEKHLDWADVVLASGMIIHWNSMEDIIKKSNQAGKPILVGGPLATQYHNQIKGNAAYFLGEAETGFQDSLEDIVRRGYRHESRVIDRKKQFLEMDKVPLQRFDLIKNNLDDYAAMAIQTTRGCPEHCTFCNIPSLYGDKTRIKSVSKVINELDSLYELGWKGMVMLVDDNLVGNQKEIMPVLKDIGRWQKERAYPFKLVTQASLRAYENEELLETMYQAGFAQVFFGLESPSLESLKSMGAQKNIQGSNERGKKNMLDKIRDIQANYFRAQAGFILGFDKDPENIAELMKEFIQESRIGVAMVGPLGVLPDTPDYKRYAMQGRLIEDARYAGDSGIITRKLSYIPADKDGNVIDPNIVLDRHREVLEYINKPENYFARNVEYFKHRNRKPLARMPGSMDTLKSFVNSLYVQGVKSDYKKEYFNYLRQVVMNDPMDIGEAVAYAVIGHHLITTTNESLKADDVNVSLEKMLREKNEPIMGRSHELIKTVAERYNSIKDNFKVLVDEQYRKILEGLSYGKDLAMNK